MYKIYKEANYQIKKNDNETQFQMLKRLSLSKKIFYFFMIIAKLILDLCFQYLM